MRTSAPLLRVVARRAATLTEILVVLAIIMCLSTLGFYGFTKATDFGNRLETQAQVAAANAQPRPEKSYLPSGAVRSNQGGGRVHPQQYATGASANSQRNATGAAANSQRNAMGASANSQRSSTGAANGPRNVPGVAVNNQEGNPIPNPARAAAIPPAGDNPMANGADNKAGRPEPLFPPVATFRKQVKVPPVRWMPRAPRAMVIGLHQFPNPLLEGSIFNRTHSDRRMNASFSTAGALVSAADNQDILRSAYLKSTSLASRKNANSNQFLDGSFVAAPAGNDLVWKAYPSTSAFLLHSNPGAKHVIYMDFDGHTTSGTAWNAQFNNGNPFTTPAWSMDANRAAFSTAELDKIIVLWRMVAEDFMPFDVDVTTEDPGPAALKNGMRAVIGPDPGGFLAGAPTPWPAAGGIAFLNSFNSPNDTPCFNWNGDSIPNPETELPLTVSHEVGHTLGLDHDGDPPLGYYSGHGAGVTSWGPIMGAPFSKNVTQWSKNTYPNADNPQDDLAIIVSNGFGYRPDDHGNTSSSATALNGVLQAKLKTTYGIIEKDTDVDYFRFGADPGPIKIQIDPLFVGPNLDIQAELYDQSGKLILAANPAKALAVNISTNVTKQGNYFLKIASAAELPVLPAGYPTYGSIGSYRITGDVTPLTAAFSTFKTLNPLRWTYNPATQTYGGTVTIGNISKAALTGTFTFVLTFPDASITVVNPVGVQTGNTYTVPYTGTIGPTTPYRFSLEVRNPNGLSLATGQNSYVTNVQSK